MVHNPNWIHIEESSDSRSPEKYFELYTFQTKTLYLSFFWTQEARGLFKVVKDVSMIRASSKVSWIAFLRQYKYNLKNSTFSQSVQKILELIC